jgi:hypothetical protein
MPLKLETLKNLLNDLRIPFSYYLLTGLSLNKSEFSAKDDKFYENMGLKNSDKLKRFYEDFKKSE